MKKLVLLTLALSLPLTQVMRADDNKKHKRDKREDQERTHQAAQQAPSQQTGNRPAPNRQIPRRVIPNQHTINRNVVQRPAALSPGVQRQAIHTERELENRNRPVRVNHNRPNNRHVNRNSYTVARSRVIRVPHDRTWWHNHFDTTFVLFGGGYYYWWDGWWYPAYGYSPYYNNYIYSEPIYAPNNLAPGQVIENVQIALRDQGYYPGAIDGIVGIQTRAALARFQQDHGLIVTEAIDEPTLVALGMA
jgi:hypothetical protein